MAKAHSMNMTAHHVVAFDRTLAAPRGPKAVWLPAPPKAPARSAALPLWSNTTMMSTRQFKTKKLESSHPAKRKDRKSTRLNSSHGYISYAVFCLKKKNK